MQKNVQMKIKKTLLTKIKKTFAHVIKKRYLFLVQFNSTPSAQEMAFKATRMSFSLVLQKLSFLG